MFSAVYHFSYPAEIDASIPSSCSTPVVPENIEEDLIAESLRSNFWYTNSPPSADLDNFPHNSDNEMEMEHGACAMASSPAFASMSVFPSDGDGMTPDGSFSSRHTIVSPKSSSFPTDLSNYVSAPPRLFRHFEI